MTIGIAAISGRPEAHRYSRGTGREIVVMAADRQLTHGAEGQPSVRADVEVPKMTSLLQRTGPGRCGWHALFAGNPDDAFRVTDRFRATTLGMEDGIPTVRELSRRLHDAIQFVRSEAYEEEVLTPWQLTRDLVLARPRTMQPLPAAILSKVTEATVAFDSDWGCDFLVCGFDEYDRPTILRANARGAVFAEQMVGYAAIGMGEDLARARLMRRNTQPSDGLADILFKVFDAKLEAEMEESVSTAPPDLWALSLAREEPTDMVEGSADALPFMAYKWAGIMAALAVPLPEETEWRKHVVRFEQWLLASASPSVPSQPSSQSQTGAKP